MDIKFDLVFEGGGAKGMAFVGALEALFEQGHSYDRLMGVSAGAIMAAFLAAGFTVTEMKETLAEKDEQGRPEIATFLAQPEEFETETIQNGMFRTWLREAVIPGVPDGLEKRFDDRLLQYALGSPLFRNIFSFVELGGWYTPDSLHQWLQNKLDRRNVNGHGCHSYMSLVEFHNLTRVDLTVLAANTTDGRLLVLNHRTAPDCPLIWAIRMSCNMPLLWPEIVWQEEWGLYRGQDITGRVVVDGGLLSNFPLELFITEKWAHVMGEPHCGHVLGLLIDERVDVPNAPPYRGSTWMDGLVKHRPVERIINLIETTTGAWDKSVVQQYMPYVVRLPARSYRTTEFGMRDSRREALLNAAYQEMSAYLEDIQGELLCRRLPLKLPSFYAQADYFAEQILG